MLDGGVGNDVLVGGAGNDEYFVNSIGDVVIESDEGFSGSTLNGITTSYMGHSYQYISGRVSYFEAAQLAEMTNDNGLFGHLLVVESAEENAFITTWLSNSAQVSGSAVWMDISDAANEGVWKYQSGSSDGLVVDYTNWYPGEGGTNSSYWNEDYAVLNFGGGSGVWSDYPFDNLYGIEGYVIELASVINMQGVDIVNTDLSVYELPINVENLTSKGLSNFTGTGNSRNNTISGGIGNDTIDGGSGDDIINGGHGNDILVGGVGSDMFVFNSALSTSNVDTITDFSSIDDTIHLDNTGIFAALSTLGVLASTSFAIGSVATDSDDAIVYNTATGGLFYDADGSGAGAAVQFAILGTGLNLTSDDFVVI